MDYALTVLLFFFWFRYVAVGRSFFDPSLGRRGELADGVEYWSGYFQSLRLTQMGLSLNIGKYLFVVFMICELLVC